MTHKEKALEIVSSVQIKTFRTLLGQKASANPIIVLKHRIDITTLVQYFLYDEDVDEKLIAEIFCPEYIVQLESVGRLFYLDACGRYHSVLFTPAIFKGVLTEESFRRLTDSLVEESIGFEPYVNGGYTVGERYTPVTKSFKLMLTKYRAPVTHGSNFLQTIDQLYEIIDSTKELEILEYIQQHELDDIKNRKKRLDFNHKLNIIKRLREERKTKSREHLYYMYWNNPWLETFASTGLWAGVHKLMGTGDGTLHQVKNSFIMLFNSAK